MLLLTFNIANGRYAINTLNVIEIVPMVEVKTIPMEEDYILGIIDYHSIYVPVIDLSSLCNNKESRRSLTTRMIITKLDNGNILGIIAENITKTISVNPDEFSSCGIKKLNADFLGDVTHDEGEIIQLVNINQILGPALQKRLYNLAEAG